MCVRTTERFSYIELGSISMDSQYHISGAIDNNVIGISHNLIKKFLYGFIGSFG